MTSRSASSTARREISLSESPLVAANGSGAAAGPGATAGATSVRASDQSCRTIIRLMKFSSSRMLPGQW
jgi:hypothetical protein